MILQHLLPDIEGRFYPNLFYSEDLLLEAISDEIKESNKKNFKPELVMVSVKPEILGEEKVVRKIKEEQHLNVRVFMTHWDLEKYTYREDNKNLYKFYCNLKKTYSEKIENKKMEICACPIVFPMKITWLKGLKIIFFSLYRFGKHESFCLMFTQNDDMYNFICEEVNKYEKIYKEFKNDS